eukprot:5345780-Amphidinium_carterae.1
MASELGFCRRGYLPQELRPLKESTGPCIQELPLEVHNNVHWEWKQRPGSSSEKSAVPSGASSSGSVPGE